MRNEMNNFIFLAEAYWFLVYKTEYVRKVEARDQDRFYYSDDFYLINLLGAELSRKGILKDELKCLNYNSFKIFIMNSDRWNQVFLYPIQKDLVRNYFTEFSLLS